MKYLSIFVCTVVLAAFTGCSYNGFTSIDAALSPPRLTEEQHLIYGALEQSVGKDIKLKYPKAGENRSAFVIENIDEEPTEEAIVFYESLDKSVTNNPNVKVNILDKQNDRWKSTSDIVGEGAEVDKVAFGRSNKFDKFFIVIGYNIVNQADKVFKVYFYENGKLKAQYSQGYSVFEVMDLDMDGDDEIVAINSGVINSGIYKAGPTAQMIKYTGQEGGFVLNSYAKMDVSVYSYVNVQKGSIYPRKAALYLDGLKGTNVYGTEVLYYENVKGKPTLYNPIYDSKSNKTEQVKRTGQTSMDINDDGIIEIPSLNPMPGYEEALASQKLQYTTWNDLVYNDFKKVVTSYVNSSDGYIFNVPDQWEKSVTAKKDTLKNEVVFFRYKQSLENDQDVVLKIKTMKVSEAQNGLPEGYINIKSNGQLVYLAYIPPLADNSFKLDSKQLETRLMLN
ncbi:MAG: hypothetical protein K0R90_42 [Oscillospiraceae bacterium]|nr:hypothetical protein [Oscillospiraceae bacterium]